MQKIALTPRSKDLISNYLIGGAALGGSGALLTSLLNYMKTLKEQAPLEAEREDDDTLYVNVPKSPLAKKAAQGAGASDLAAGGLALTGGLMATLGSYAAVRKAYQAVKRKQLQEQLDQSQQIFLDQAAQEAEQSKRAGVLQPQAGKPMGLAELGWSSPVAFALLSAIAAGALTNKALDKTFPQVKKPTNPGPKRVVVRKAPPAPVEEEEPEKVAFDKFPEQDHMDNGVEYLIHLAMGSKSASESDLVDIVHAVAQGRKDEFVQNMMQFGFDTAMDTIKGASENKLSTIERQLAAGICVKSAALNPVVTLLAAAEYADMAPRFTSIASLQNKEAQETLCKIASAIGAINRAEVFERSSFVFEDAPEKQAASGMSIEQILQIMNQMRGTNPHRDEEIDQNDDLTSEDSINSSEEKQVNDRRPMQSNKIAPQVINELDEEDDAIDQALSQPIAPAKPVASITQ